MRRSRNVAGMFIFAIFCIGVFLSEGGFADEIVLKNGDRLTGKVITSGKEVIKLETAYAGTIDISISHVRSIVTDDSVDVHLTSGEVLRGALSTDDQGNLVVGPSDGRGPLVVAIDDVASFNPPPLAPSTWDGSVTVGASTQSGNSDRTNVSIGADAVRRTERDRYSLRFLYNYAEEDKDVTARSYYGAGKYDFFFTRKFYGYLSLELLKDKFKDLKLRTVVGPGVGYQVWDEADRALALEAGLAYFSEDLYEGEDDDWISARLAADFRYRLFDAIVFTDQFVIWPSLENGKDYKLRNEAAITSPLAGGWSLKLANILEHDGNPPEDVERNDWYWILGLLYNF